VNDNDARQLLEVLAEPVEVPPMHTQDIIRTGRRRLVLRRAVGVTAVAVVVIAGVIVGSDLGDTPGSAPPAIAATTPNPAPPATAQPPNGEVSPASTADLVATKTASVWHSRDPFHPFNISFHREALRPGYLYWSMHLGCRATAHGTAKVGPHGSFKTYGASWSGPPSADASCPAWVSSVHRLLAARSILGRGDDLWFQDADGAMTMHIGNTSHFSCHRSLKRIRGCEVPNPGFPADPPP